MESIITDVRYAIRTLVQNPVFALVSIVVLAFGIGATTTVFSVVDGVLVRQLPFPSPERLVAVWETNDQASPEYRFRTEASPANYLDWCERNTSFENLAALSYSSLPLVTRDQPVRLEGAAVTPNFFQTLGVSPVAGRDFAPGDGVPNAAPVAIISTEVWNSAFGADPAVVGSLVNLGGRPVTIAGVLPAGFNFPFPRTRGIDVWVPMQLDPAKADRQAHFLYVVGRLRDGVSMPSAQEEIAGIGRQLAAEHADTNAGRSVRPVSLHEWIVSDVRSPLLLLFAAVGAVLLVACGNVANMLLARGTHRRREIAVRTAIGASRRRIVRQLLTESAVLSLSGGALGLLLSAWSVDLLRGIGADFIPRLAEIEIRWPVFGFAFAVSLVTAIAFGLGPALRATRDDLFGSLKSGDRAVGTRMHDRVRGMLVAAEIGVTIVLLIAAGLLVRSFVQLVDVDPGLDPSNVMTLDVAIPRAKYVDDVRIAAFFNETLARIAAAPGVEAVGAIDPLPLSESDNSVSVTIVGQPVPPPPDRPEVGFRIASPGYFEAMRIPVCEGRAFSDADDARTTGTVVVNRAFAERFWPGVSAVGQHITIPEDSDDPAALGPVYEVVGVVGNVRHTALDIAPKPECYATYRQDPARYLTVVVRSPLPADRVAGLVRDAVRAVDPDQPVHNVLTMEQRVAGTVARRRMAMLLAGAFAAVALLIAAVGLYGVLSYFVEQREREIGVRMALGARRADVLRLVVGQGLTYVVVGLVAGSVAALLLSRVIASQLYGVSAVDPVTYVAIDAAVLLVATAATLVPALRATAVDPTVALRSE